MGKQAIGTRARRLVLGCSILALGSAAAAQEAARAEAPDSSGAAESESGEIVITGMRGAVRTDAAPVAVLDQDAIAATGATTMGELLQAVRGTTQSADGSEPIFLINAQRVSGYQEVGSLPPEAIDKVEVLPEPVALRFGYPPTRRVVNFITKRRFAQMEARATAGTTTMGGSDRANANFGLSRLRDDSRLTVTMEARHTDSLLQARRNITPDPEIPFDALGNVVAIDGAEIDPALSAAAGGIVTIVPVPEAAADRTLAGFAAGANRPRLFDLGPYRTVVPRTDAVKGEAVFAAPIGALAGSFSLSGERSRERSLYGSASASLLIPQERSIFTRDVLLSRYLVEADPLHGSQTTTSLHAGGTLRGALAGWRWDATVAFDEDSRRGTSERGIDLSAANAAVADGANPFAPLDPALLANRLVDRSRQRTRTIGAKTNVIAPPIALPAGEATVTGTAEAERATASSSTRGPNPFDLDLGRTRTEAGFAVDLPLASRRMDVLAFAGELSLNASLKARRVGGFGALSDRTLGFSWGPLNGLQFQGQLRRSAAPPGLSELSSPVLRAVNVPVFDFGSGTTEIVSLIRGGNPDLEAERRRVSSLSVNLKPLAKRELRLGATWEATTISDQVGTITALTPITEAAFPDLVTRDAAGRLIEVRFQPINFFRERQETLNLTLNSSGPIGKAAPAAPGAKPPPQPHYYGGLGSRIRFSDTLQLRPGAPELDLLNGDTVAGWSAPRVSAWAWGGINYLGNGMNFDVWYGGKTRVRSDNPAANLYFSSILKLNLSAFVSVHHFLPKQEWTGKTQLRLEISNLTNARQTIRDRNGVIPYRFQADLLDPVGRTISLSLRKRF